MENNLEEKEGTQEELVSELQTLNSALAKQQSVRYMLRNGMLYGVGFVIGSSILAGVVISALVFLFGDVPLIGSVVEQADPM